MGRVYSGTNLHTASCNINTWGGVPSSSRLCLRQAQSSLLGDSLDILNAHVNDVLTITTLADQCNYIPMLQLIIQALPSQANNDCQLRSVRLLHLRQVDTSNSSQMKTGFTTPMDGITINHHYSFPRGGAWGPHASTLS